MRNKRIALVQNIIRFLVILALKRVAPKTDTKRIKTDSEYILSPNTKKKRYRYLVWRG